MTFQERIDQAQALQTSGQPLSGDDMVFIRNVVMTQRLIDAFGFFNTVAAVEPTAAEYVAYAMASPEHQAFMAMGMQ
jgi:hypothetical protein